MKDPEIIPITNTRNLAKDAPFSEEIWADVSSDRNAAQEGSVELVEADASRSEGNGRNDRLWFSVRPPIPLERFGRCGSGSGWSGIRRLHGVKK
jgi:hypothetical protein